MSVLWLNHIVVMTCLSSTSVWWVVIERLIVAFLFSGGNWTSSGSCRECFCNCLPFRSLLGFDYIVYSRDMQRRPSPSLSPPCSCNLQLNCAFSSVVLCAPILKTGGAPSGVKRFLLSQTSPLMWAKDGGQVHPNTEGFGQLSANFWDRSRGSRAEYSSFLPSSTSWCALHWYVQNLGRLGLGPDQTLERQLNKESLYSKLNKELLVQERILCR